MHSLGIVQWNSIRRDHPGNPGGVSGSGPVKNPPDKSCLSILLSQKVLQSRVICKNNNELPH